MLSTSKFSSQMTGKKFEMRLKASWKSPEVVYLIICRRCGQQYVGETGQPLHRRISSHRYNIAHQRTDESPVAKHFNHDAHSQADMVMMVIDQVWSSDPFLLKTMENRWIRILWTSHPFGLNLKVDSL